MKNMKEQVEKPRQVALYSHMESDGWLMIREFKIVDYDEHYHSLPQGETREESYEGFARVSEPVEISFKAISNDEIVAKAVEALNAEELKILTELNTKLAKLRDRKNQLLSLTHQVEGA